MWSLDSSFSCEWFSSLKSCHGGRLNHEWYIWTCVVSVIVCWLHDGHLSMSLGDHDATSVIVGRQCTVVYSHLICLSNDISKWMCFFCRRELYQTSVTASWRILIVKFSLTEGRSITGRRMWLSVKSSWINWSMHGIKIQVCVLCWVGWCYEVY